MTDDTTPSPWRARLRALGAPRAILVIAWLGFLMYGYPGFMTTPAADELVDARVGEYTDWHSPVMAGIWHWLGWVVSGPPGMLLLQGLLLLAGSYHLLRRVLAPRPAALVAGAVLWFPPILATTSVISADGLLASMLVAGAAAVASARRGVQLLGLITLGLACGLREGAALAALPICALGIAGIPAGWRRPAIGLGVWLALATGAMWLRDWIPDHPSGRRELDLAVHDLAGTLRFAGKLDGAELARQLDRVTLVTTDHLEANARVWYAHPEQVMYGAHKLFAEPVSYAGVENIVAGRDRVIAAHRGAYLRYRLHMLLRVLKPTRTKRGAEVYQDFTETKPQRFNLSYAARSSPIQALGHRVMRGLGKTVLFRPYLYFALAVLALGVAFWRRERAAVMLLASGLGYELALMFVASEPEYRESHWMTTATCLAIALLAAGWRVRSRRAAG